MVAIVGGALLAAGVVLCVLEPILAGRSAPLYDHDADSAEADARRKASLKALRELEYDRVTGKLEAADYESLRAELARDALAHLKATGRGVPSGEQAQIEAEIARVRRAIEAGLECGVCERVNRLGARYCAECGGALEGTRAGAAST